MFLYFGWIIVLVVLCNIFLLECGFFFCVCFLCLKCQLLFFVYVFRFIDFFVLGLLVLFYVFGDLFILLFD